MANLSNFTPELSDLINYHINRQLLDLNVCMPAKIVKYNRSTQYADVQPQLYQKFADGSLVAFPVIPSVPVKHPRANDGNAFIHMPLVPGDDVTLIMSQRSLDNWKTQGGMSDPNDTRKHHITDAYALIGGSAIPDAFAPQTSNGLEIVNGATSLILLPDGTVKIANAANELISLLDQWITQDQSLAQTLSTDTVNTIFGATKLNAFLTYTQIANQLSAIKTKLETFLAS